MRTQVRLVNKYLKSSKIRIPISKTLDAVFLKAPRKITARRFTSENIFKKKIGTQSSIPFSLCGRPRKPKDNNVLRPLLDVPPPKIECKQSAVSVLKMVGFDGPISNKNDVPSSSSDVLIPKEGHTLNPLIKTTDTNPDSDLISFFDWLVTPSDGMSTGREETPKKCFNNASILALYNGNGLTAAQKPPNETIVGPIPTLATPLKTKSNEHAAVRRLVGSEDSITTKKMVKQMPALLKIPKISARGVSMLAPNKKMQTQRTYASKKDNHLYAKRLPSLLKIDRPNILKSPDAINIHHSSTMDTKDLNCNIEHPLYSDILTSFGQLDYLSEGE